MGLEVKQQIFNTINNSENILIAVSKNFTYDDFSSAVAFKLFLDKLGKKSDIATEKFDQKKLNFLTENIEILQKVQIKRDFLIRVNPGAVQITNLRYEKQDHSFDIIIETKDGILKESDINLSKQNFPYDLIITIGVVALETLGEIYEKNRDLFFGVPIINIDKRSQNENFAQINLVDINFSSISEIIFELFKGQSINKEIASAILAGIISGTNSFKTIKVTPTTFKTVSELIEVGADRELIVRNLYRVYTIADLKLFGRALARSKQSEDGKIAWSIISPDDFIKTKTDEENIDGIINEFN